jgi:hypothetical protein
VCASGADEDDAARVAAGAIRLRQVVTIATMVPAYRPPLFRFDEWRARVSYQVAMGN